jgi:L-threonylcarbamoyladenylate synthase
VKIPSLILNPSDIQTIPLIVDHLRQGECVAIPTETVYGLAADASNPKAINKIFALKGRPESRPLSVLLADKNQMQDWAVNIPEIAWRLASKFWPGPLTLIVPKAPHVSENLTAGQASIGLRVPAHPIALDILKAFAGGLAAPSANLFSQPSPQTVKEVVYYFPNELWIVDGGAASYGIASTIVDCTVSPPRILRQGALASEEIFQCV